MTPPERDQKLDELTRLTEELGLYDHKSEFKPRRCRECGEGTIRPLAKDGQQVAIPTCDRCGSEWIDPETANSLDDANRSCGTSR